MDGAEAAHLSTRKGHVVSNPLLPSIFVLVLYLISACSFSAYHLLSVDFFSFNLTMDQLARLIF